MKKINLYIQESLNKVDIDKIKDFLIKKYKVSTWEECIDKQEFGTCEKIVKVIWENFYKMFDCAVDIDINYSEQAQELINDNKEMNGNHYVLKKDGKYYDFARGANCINGIYVLTQNWNKDKYNIILTKEEENLIVNKYRRFGPPKEILYKYREEGSLVVNWKELSKDPWYKRYEKLKP